MANVPIWVVVLLSEMSERKLPVDLMQDLKWMNCTCILRCVKSRDEFIVFAFRDVYCKKVQGRQKQPIYTVWNCRANLCSFWLWYFFASSLGCIRFKWYKKCNACKSEMHGFEGCALLCMLTLETVF